MKEKALKRYAHFISILLNIVCIVFGVLSVSLFAGIVVIVCARLFLPEMFHQAWEMRILFHLLSWNAHLYLFSPV